MIFKDHHGIVAIFFSVSKESSLANSPRTLIFFWIKAMKLPKKMWNCKDSVHGRPMSGTSVSFDLFHTSKGFQRHFPCPKQCGPIGSLRAPSCCSSRSWPKITTHTDVPFCRHQPAGCSWLFSPPFRCIGLFKRKIYREPPKKQEGGILYITCSIKTSPGSLNRVPQFCF